MSGYSPQAQALLEQWNCISLNMRSVILRSRYLQKQAEQNGYRDRLDAVLREKEVHAQYRQIRHAMREVSGADGVEKSFPEATDFIGPEGVGRFVEFRISETAIPELRERLDEVDYRIQKLLITLCTIHPE